MIRLIRNIIIVSLFAFLMTSSGDARAQTDSKELLDRTVGMQIKNGTFLQALSTLAVDNFIPIGFEPCNPYKDEFDLNIDVSDRTLRDLLEKIVEQRPDYRWEFRDGAINILPIRSRDELVNRFLETPIRRFAPQKGLDQLKLRDQIIELPEVQTFLKDNKLTPNRYGYVSRSDPHPSQLDLSSSGVDLRQVLNKVIRNGNRKMWIVSRRKNADTLDELVIGL